MFSVSCLTLESETFENETFDVDQIAVEVLEQAVTFLNNVIQQRKAETAEQIQKEIAQLQAKLASLSGSSGNTAVKTRLPTAKYRNPNNPEETYGGHGKRPQWFIDALAIVQGNDDATARVLENLRVK